MPLKNARYVHVQTPHGKSRGFSVLMSPSEVEGTVDVSTAVCNNVDQFCRRDARFWCQNNPVSNIPIPHLPQFIADLHARCEGVTLTKQNARAWGNRYTWLWKYFL